MENKNNIKRTNDGNEFVFPPLKKTKIAYSPLSRYSPIRVKYNPKLNLRYKVLILKSLDMNINNHLLAKIFNCKLDDIKEVVMTREAILKESRENCQSNELEIDAIIEADIKAIRAPIIKDFICPPQKLKFLMEYSSTDIERDVPALAIKYNCTQQALRNTLKELLPYWSKCKLPVNLTPKKPDAPNELVEAIELIILEWMSRMWDLGQEISDGTLQEKANELSNTVGSSVFKPDEKWLFVFKNKMLGKKRLSGLNETKMRMKSLESFVILRELYDDRTISEASFQTICKAFNNKIPPIQSYEEALEHLKPLEDFVLIRENFRAIGLINQIENILKDHSIQPIQVKNELF